jgi:hypothetical protein
VTAVIEETTHKLVVVGGETFTWTVVDDEAVARVAAEFATLTRTRRAETLGPDGLEVIRTFDPAAQETIVYPQIVGG